MTSSIPSLLAAVLLASAGAGLAQAPQAATPRVDQRQENQATRITQGSPSGALTAREQRRLNREQAATAKAETHAKADGTVTAQERRRLQRMQNKASRDIRRQKHDPQQAATQAPK